MKKPSLLLVLVLLFGCTRARSLPDMPAFQTQRGAECAMDCQKMHSWCTSGCVKGESKRARKTCFSLCSEKLEDCYSLCSIQD